MSDIITKIKVWWQKVSTKTPLYNRKGLSPVHDWTIIFITTQIVIAVGALGAYYFYKAVDSGDFFAVTEEITQNEVKINIGLLQKTVDDINAREKKLAESSQGGSVPTDPSR